GRARSRARTLPPPPRGRGDTPLHAGVADHLDPGRPLPVSPGSVGGADPFAAVGAYLVLALRARVSALHWRPGQVLPGGDADRRGALRHRSPDLPGQPRGDAGLRTGAGPDLVVPRRGLPSAGCDDR